MKRKQKTGRTACPQNLRL